MQSYNSLAASLCDPLFRTVVNVTLVSYEPTTSPVQANQPSPLPIATPSFPPSDGPSLFPSDSPSYVPSDLPSQLPSDLPSWLPSDSPSTLPSDNPSTIPSPKPSSSPSIRGTMSTNGTTSKNGTTIKTGGRTRRFLQAVSGSPSNAPSVRSSTAQPSSPGSNISLLFRVTLRCNGCTKNSSLFDSSVNRNRQLLVDDIVGARMNYRSLQQKGNETTLECYCDRHAEVRGPYEAEFLSLWNQNIVNHASSPNALGSAVALTENSNSSSLI